MAENVEITPGVGDVVGADDISGVKYQRVKIIHGDNGTNDGDVSTTNGLPVQGTVTANLSATDNAVLDTIDSVLDDIKVDTEAIETAVEAIQSGQLADSHNVTVDNASIAITNAGITSIDGKITACNTGAVAGTVTANLSATDNAVLDQIELNTDPLLVVGGGAEATAQRVTIANDSTGVVSVDDNGGALTVDGTVTANLSATDNAVLDTIDSVLDTINAKLVTGTVIGDVNLGATDNAVLDTIAAKDFATQTTLAAMNAKMVTGTDIGDVTINNSTGAAAVNIQDGGNAITVDGSVTVDMGANNDVTCTNATAANLKCEESSAAAIKTAVEALDNSVDGNYLNVNMNIAGADVSATVPVPVRPNEFELAGVTTHVKKYYTNAGAVTDGIIWSPAAGKRWYVTDIFIQVSAAATVTLEDDLAGGDSPVWKAELAANSGWSHSFNTPLYSGEDAADLIITTSAGNVYVTCVGYEI